MRSTLLRPGASIYFARSRAATIQGPLALLHGGLVGRVLCLLLFELFVGRSLGDHVGQELEVIDMGNRRSYCAVNTLLRPVETSSTTNLDLCIERSFEACVLT